MIGSMKILSLTGVVQQARAIRVARSDLDEAANAVEDPRAKLVEQTRQKFVGRSEELC
jgi:hypothetical protein